MDPYANEWLSFLARWLHVIAAIVWIGTSFYFVALDNHLRENESWEIHGGGFYRVEKFRLAPPRLPDVLHWFKWEAYTTWLSGFALLVFLYYFNATRTSSGRAGRSARAGDRGQHRPARRSPGSSTTRSAGVVRNELVPGRAACSA